MFRTDEREDAEEERQEASSRPKLRSGRGKGWATPAVTPPLREPLSSAEPAWRSVLPPLKAAPLQALLDPGLSLVVRTAPTFDTFGSEIPGLYDPTLPNLSRLEVINLLEQPELPVHRASRPAEDALPAQEWRHLPPSQRKRHDAPLPPVAHPPEDVPAPAEPRPYVFGQVGESTVDATLQSLAALDVVVPDIGASNHLRLQVNLGQGQGAFLNARSALWSWRPHRQSGVRVHTHGPPVIGRDVLLEQRIGLVNVLQGCRVMTLTEEDRCWGFTLGSLDRQVYRLWERLLVEWQEDDRVTLLISSHHEQGLRGFGLVAPLLNSTRRNTVQGYARGMTDLAQL